MAAARQYSAEIKVAESDRLNQAKKYSEARQAAWEATQKDPNNGYALFNAAINEVAQNRYKEAIPYLEKALECMPHLPNVLRLLGQANYSIASYDKSVKYLDRYFLMNPRPAVTPEYLFNLYGQALYRGLKPGRATYVFSVADQYPGYRAEILHSRVITALLINQLTTTDYCYRRMRTSTPRKLVDPAELFSACLETNKLGTAIRFYEQLWIRGETDPEALKTLAMSYSKVKRYDEAVVVLKQAYNYASTDPEISLLLGDIHATKQDNRTAVDWYNIFLQNSKDQSLKDEVTTKVQNLKSTF
ncbi:MAG: tetratricopeptide repeat protein [Candidatus Sumerlaeaceae bacterium]|nr:tetratricopeptide repeat protein [Candidatus Sumerlaeaceae bacterium]